MPTVTIGDGAAIGVAPTPPMGVAPTPPTAGEGGG